MKTWIEHQSEDGRFLTGYWEATPGSYRVRYAADEFIHLFEGRVTQTDNGQEPRSFSAGDSFVIEAGFDGIWKTEETVRKTFAIRVPWQDCGAAGRGAWSGPGAMPGPDLCARFRAAGPAARPEWASSPNRSDRDRSPGLPRPRADPPSASG
nr:cupin domain-containing protein [Paracoccus binzhouensis]